MGSQRVAGGEEAEGFVVFDAPAGPPSALVSLNTIHTDVGSEGSTIALVGSRAAIDYRRYDAQGTPIGNAVTLANGIPPGVTALTIASGNGESLVVWGLTGTVHAAAVTAGGTPAGPPFVLATNTFVSFLRISAVRSASKTAIVWSGDPAPGKTATKFVLASPTGPTGTTVDVATGSYHGVVRLVVTASGYAVALNGSSPPNEVLVVLLDGSGKAVGPAHRLLGANLAWDLVAEGGELGLLAARGGGEVMFRPLDAAAKPLGPWVCFNGGIGPAALDSEGTGYAAVYRASGGDVSLARFGHLGTGAP